MFHRILEGMRLIAHCPAACASPAPRSAAERRRLEARVGQAFWIIHSNFKKSSTFNRACFKMCANVERLTGRCAGTVILSADGDSTPRTIDGESRLFAARIARRLDAEGATCRRARNCTIKRCKGCAARSRGHSVPAAGQSPAPPTGTWAAIEAIYASYKRRLCQGRFGSNSSPDDG